MILPFPLRLPRNSQGRVVGRSGKRTSGQGDFGCCLLPHLQHGFLSGYPDPPPRHSSTSQTPKATYQQIPQHLGSVVAHQPRLLNAKTRKPPGRKRNPFLAQRVRQGRVLVPGRGGARAPDHRERRESQSDSSQRPV